MSHACATPSRPQETPGPLHDSPLGPHVLSVNLSAVHSFSKDPAPEARFLEGLGVEGDAHCGTTVRHRFDRGRDPHRPDLRQVHLIGTELFDEVAAHVHAVSGQAGRPGRERHHDGRGPARSPRRDAAQARPAGRGPAHRPPHAVHAHRLAAAASDTPDVGHRRGRSTHPPGRRDDGDDEDRGGPARRSADRRTPGRSGVAPGAGVTLGTGPATLPIGRFWIRRERDTMHGEGLTTRALARTTTCMRAEESWRTPTTVLAPPP